MLKDDTAPEKTNVVVGSRQWFSIPLESKIEVYPQHEKSDSDYSEPSPEQVAHLSYNMVQQDVTIGFIYIRKQYDKQIGLCLTAMADVFKAGLETYLQEIQKKITAGEAENLSLFTSTKLFPQDHKNPVEEDLASIFDDAETKEKIFNIWHTTTGSDRHTAVANEIIDFEILEGMATARAADLFFKGPFEGRNLEDLMKLTTKGFIYQPPDGDHSWEANLGWLLSHLHKGNSFVVCSRLSEENQLRKTPDYENDLSGFSRELAVLLKTGYEIKTIEAERYELLPSEDLTTLENLSLDDIKLEDNDVKVYYQKALEAVQQPQPWSTTSPNSPEQQHTIDTPQAPENNMLFGFHAHRTSKKQKITTETEANISQLAEKDVIKKSTPPI